MSATGDVIQKMKAALAGTLVVRTWWAGQGLTGAAFRAWFLERLQAKINRGDTRRWRRLEPEYQTSLLRDARRLQDIQKRIVVRQFETDICRKRFAHLLTTD
jgi:hypothetical protein